MKHFTVIFKPVGQRISVHAGATLLEAAGQAGIILNTPCGGQGMCGKCKLLLEPHLRAVVACQYRIESDLEVVVPRESQLYEHKILEDGVGQEASVVGTIYEQYVELMAVERVLGVAVDVGTTTVVAKLVRLCDGQIVQTESDLNPQTQFGDDVVSRISHAETAEGGRQLRDVIVDCINMLIDRLCRESSTQVDDICEVCIVGNTAMNHIFLGLPLAQLGQAPYEAHSVDAFDIAASQCPLHMNERGNVHTVANIAGFVGADITAAALAVDIGSGDGATLMVDIGTNGEIVLAAGGRLLAASCAAGPAFEGARIRCGSRAAEGAIEAVVTNEHDIGIDVIGGGDARSICGSGLIDAVAVMLELGLVDSSGRFVDSGSLDGLTDDIARRLAVVEGGPAFYLSKEVFITQADIRQVQLAKAAIRAGIAILQARAGLEDGDIDRILLAGAFGSYIRRESALRIGLLPEVAVSRIKFVGNAACSGARMALLSRRMREQATDLARGIEYVEIANEPSFTDIYTDAMFFG